MAPEGLETLLLRRNAKLAFAGGAWVFPGGAIDQSELEGASSEEQAARTATVREVHEECGLTVTEDASYTFATGPHPLESGDVLRRGFLLLGADPAFRRDINRRV